MKKLTIELSEVQMKDFESFLIGAILEQKEYLRILREDSQDPDLEPEDLKSYEQRIVQREKELETANAVLENVVRMERRTRCLQ